MNIKMSPIFSLLVVLFVVSAFNVTMSDAQDYARWGLPEGTTARLGKGTIKAIAYSPDGSQLAVAGGAGIWIYDAATGEERSLLTGHTDLVRSIRYSPDGSTIASASMDSTVCIWDAATGKHLHTLLHTTSRGHTDYVTSLAYSPDGSTIASAIANGGGIYIWDTATGTLRNRSAAHGGNTSDIAFSPDGSTIASANWRRQRLDLWDAATGVRINTLEPNEQLWSVAYSPDGSTIATGTPYATVILWDAAIGIPIDTLRVHGSYTYTIAYSPDGSTIATGSSDAVYLWDAATSRLKHTLKHTSSTTIESVAYSPDGATLASGSRDGTVRLWNASTGTLRHTITGHTNEVNAVAYSPDGNSLAIGSTHSVTTASLWDVTTGTFRNLLEVEPPDRGRVRISSLAYSPDGSTIVGGNRGDAYLWDAATHKIRRRFEGTSGAKVIMYSPDGAAIATSMGAPIALSPDGTKLVTLGGGLSGTVANLSDVTTGRIIKSFTITPDIVSPDNWLFLWDVATRKLIDRFVPTPEDRGVNDFAYSPDGNTVAAAIEDSVYLWDATTGRLKYRFTEDTHDGHYFDVRSVAFSPDSTTVASGGGFYDRTVRLWDVKTGTLKNILHGHFGAVEDLEYSPDGTTLASASHDGTVLLWNFAPTPTEPDRIPADVNSDGKVNIQDMVLVASNFGQTGENHADVNGDGKVNIADLVLVAGALGNAAAAPMVSGRDLEVALTRTEVQQWLTQAQRLNLTDAISRRGIHFLEQLLLVLTPKETTLLANYPNPFNPETWIPYQLASPADVVLRIYTVDGGLVQTLSLGHQTMGRYQSRSRAAYWDGKNALGESVASGVYFYTLTAGDFTATRKMLIRK